MIIYSIRLILTEVTSFIILNIGINYWYFTYPILGVSDAYFLLMLIKSLNLLKTVYSRHLKYHSKLYFKSKQKRLAKPLHFGIDCFDHRMNLSVILDPGQDPGLQCLIAMCLQVNFNWSLILVELFHTNFIYLGFYSVRISIVFVCEYIQYE